MSKKRSTAAIKIYYEKKEILKKESAALLEAMKCLAEEEFRQFKVFLRSSFFNRDESVSKLFDRLSTALQKDSTNIRGKDLSKKLFPGDDDEKGLLKLTEALKKLEQLIFRFISVTEMSADPTQEQRLLTIGLKKRKHTELFYEAADKFEKMLAQEPPTIMRLSTEWWLDHQRYFHQYAQQSQSDLTWFESSNRKIDLFTHLVKLRYLCESYNRRNVINSGSIVNIPAHLLENPASERQTLAVIWMYQEVLPLVRDQFNLPLARKLLYHLVNKSAELAPADQVVLAKLLFNALLRSINRPNPQGMAQLVALSKHIVRHDLYLFEGVISDDEYLNLAIMSGVGGAFKFQAFFIEQYANHLEENVRDKARRFALVYHHFHLGRYPEAIDGLKHLFPPKTQDEDKYVFRAKALLLRVYLAYYLRGHYDSYDEYIRASENFRRFLSRHEGFSERYYVAYKNLITLGNALVQCANQQQFGPEIVHQMQQKLEEHSPVIAHAWLREQIPLLEKRRSW